MALCPEILHNIGNYLTRLYGYLLLRMITFKDLVIFLFVGVFSLLTFEHTEVDRTSSIVKPVHGVCDILGNSL